jgi:transcription elongation factor B subunit 1
MAPSLETTPAVTYGGCEGHDSAYVKLVSSDGHEFVLKRSQVLTAGTIQAM